MFDSNHTGLNFEDIEFSAYIRSSAEKAAEMIEEVFELLGYAKLKERLSVEPPQIKY